jgi:Phasin protein
MKTQKTNGPMEEAASKITDHARDTIMTVNNSLMKAFEQNRVITQNLFKAMQEESLRFMNTRLEHTSRAFEKSRECQGIPQLVTLQHDWLMDIARDYAELNKRFGEVLQEMTEQTADHASDLVTDASRVAQKTEKAAERAAAE